MDNTALYKISYGLFVVTARDNQFDNGCIGNVCVQVASSPTRLALALNKLNKTCWMVKNSGQFNLSILSQSAPFEVFKRFGFQSGADVDKFADVPKVRTENGVVYWKDNVNAVISARVVDTTDLGSHLLFIAEIDDATTLSSEESMTYDYYQKQVKPKPQESKVVKGWRCKICGYVHEGEELPENFVCPTCKHGPEDFEKIQ
ncbi:MAG: flavin reductase [Planctomycetia bacterium]|nr:flavin reductase [Planctomycetia bacterium]